LNGIIELHPLPRSNIANARDQHARSPQQRWVQLDSRSGAVLTKVAWQDLPTIARLVSLGIDLHEGHFFGRANQIFNTLMASALIWLSVTGFIGWYKRRPQGGLAAPPKRELRYPTAIMATGLVLCVALPLLGLSVLAISALDRVAGRFLTAPT
jgi:uncharacterized iron-regulated membrane protein